MTLAPWRRRFLAPQVSLPRWARHRPERLVYKSNETGKWELYAWDAMTDERRQITERPTGTFDGMVDATGSTIWWFDDEGGNELGRWMTVPFAGGAAQPLSDALPVGSSAGLAFGRDTTVVGIAQSGKGASVYTANAREDFRLIHKDPLFAYVADLSWDETLLSLEFAMNGDMIHSDVRALRPDGRVVAELSDGPNLALYPWGWAPLVGDNRMLVAHERYEQMGLLIWTPETGEVEELRIDLPGDVSGGWYPDGLQLLLVHGFRGRDELYTYDLETSAVERLPTEPGTIWWEAAVRPDGEVWYSWSNAATAPEIRAGDRTLLTVGEPAPAGVTYTEHQVGDIPLFVAEPEGQRPHPVVFQVHGGPTGHDADAFSSLVQAWVDHGFAVVLVNYRGSISYGRAWRDALQDNPGFAELDDIATVHDWVLSQGIGQTGGSVLAGYSWGGYLTLLGLGTQPERWDLGIAAIPLADLALAYEDAAEPLRAYDRSLFKSSPDERPDFWRERSPITYVDRIRAPLLIIAGENDTRCPLRQVEQYVSRLNGLGKRHEFYQYDAGHAWLVVEETIRQVELQIDFAHRHLGTPAPL